MGGISLNRRQLLRAGAAAGAIGIAGCTGNGEDGDGGGGDDGGTGTSDGLPCVERSGSERLSAPLSVSGPWSNTLRFGAPLSSGRVTRPVPSAQTFSLEEVPLELHRRAAQLIEDVRNSDSVPTWEDARLSGAVYAVSRPDVGDTAYLEFEVDPTGFIVLSTGVHDFPVPHWNHVGRPITAVLEQRAQAVDERATNVYRLDTLTYVAVNDDGERVASYGPEMVKIDGLDDEWLERRDEVSRATAAPTLRPSDVTPEGRLEYTVERSGPDPLPVGFEPWESWGELIEEYERVYRYPLAHLRQEAETEREEYRRPRRLDSAETPTDRLAILAPVERVGLSGAGSEFVQATVVDREGEPSVVEVSLREDPGEVLEFEVSIAYEDGQKEVVEYVIATAQQNEAFASGSSLGARRATSHTLSCGGTYDLDSAGTAAHQRMYHQFSTGSCDPGAGAVAWATLFGWADYQASLGSSLWDPRWGLFRQNGGTDPLPDDVAPRTQNSAVEAVIKEIQQDISYCIGTTGVTPPSEMVNAWHYFEQRTATVLDTEWVPYKYNSKAHDRAVQSIAVRGTPAVIGTGFGNTYLLAWKHAQLTSSGSGGCQELFYVNHGEGETTDADQCLDNGHGWIPAKAWFCGWILPGDPSQAEP